MDKVSRFAKFLDHVKPLDPIEIGKFYKTPDSMPRRGDRNVVVYVFGTVTAEEIGMSDPQPRGTINMVAIKVPWVVSKDYAGDFRNTMCIALVNKKSLEPTERELAWKPYEPSPDLMDRFKRSTKFLIIMKFVNHMADSYTDYAKDATIQDVFGTT